MAATVKKSKKTTRRSAKCKSRNTRPALSFAGLKFVPTVEPASNIEMTRNRVIALAENLLSKLPTQDIVAVIPVLEKYAVHPSA